MRIKILCQTHLSVSISSKNTLPSLVSQEILRSESKVIIERMCPWRWQESNFPALFDHLAVSSWLPRSDVRQGASAHNQGIDRAGAAWTFSPHLRGSCRLEVHTERTENAFPWIFSMMNCRKGVFMYLYILIIIFDLLNTLDYLCMLQNIWNTVLIRCNAAFCECWKLKSLLFVQLWQHFFINTVFFIV